uniref:tol-pal system protein YbgF n=1 Tax=Alloalcanivorax venustensis TaxID=172371 RepID=UPI0035168EE7
PPPGPLAVEERGSGGGRASSPATGNGGGEEGIYLLMQEMEQYQKQVQNLQGQVEELRHELTQLKGAERERYLDLDTRINALVEQVNSAPKTDAEAGDDGGNSDTPADPEADREAYSAARGKLLERDFDAAATAFEAYLKDFPQGQFRAHAHFWLGEVYSNQKTPQLDKARKQFQTVVDDYPNHSRAPTSLYKLASLQAQAGNTGEAEVSLHKLIKQFPDASEAEMAKSMLKQLNGD